MVGRFQPPWRAAAVVIALRASQRRAGRQGIFMRWVLTIRRFAPGYATTAFGVVPAIVLLLCASLLAALETPSKPFLDKNSFLLSSAGFRVQFANDEAGRRALQALPPHRFVMHKNGGDVRYLYAEPIHCVCIFIGTPSAYQDYRDILGRGLPQPDDVSPDYKTQADALLYGDVYDWDNLNQPDSAAEILRTYY
jgi:hypothetical protein